MNRIQRAGFKCLRCIERLNVKRTLRISSRIISTRLARRTLVVAIFATAAMTFSFFQNQNMGYAGVVFPAVDPSQIGADAPPESRFEDRSPAGLIIGPENYSPTPLNPVSKELTLPAMPGPSSASAQWVPDNRKGIQEVAVIAGDLGFFPNTLFVNRDIPVRLFVTGASKNTLCIMMDSFHVRKQVKTNQIQEIEFTPNVPGKYRFYCPVNGVEGTLVVREMS